MKAMGASRHSSFELSRVFGVIVVEHGKAFGECRNPEGLSWFLPARILS